MLKDNPSVILYQSHAISKLTRPELGIKGFKDIESQLSQLRTLIDEILRICDSNEEIPSDLKNTIYPHVNTFNEHANEIVKYDIDRDGLQRRDKIIREFN